MGAEAVTGTLQLEAPGPGSWGIDAVHFPRPVTRYFAELHPEPFKRGSAEFARFYGMPLGGLEFRYVEGFAYSTRHPAPDDEIPDRFARAEAVWEHKLWREQLREWDEEAKPAAIATHRELQAVDPDALSDEELVAYLTRCRDHHAAMVHQHMRFTAAPSIPTGDLLVHAGAWTGIPTAELLGLLRGSAPVSAGASGELAGLHDALAQDPAARELLASDDDPATVLQRLRTHDGPAGAAAAAYLDLVGNRLLDGFDIANACAIEVPDALVRAIRAAVEEEAPEAADAEARAAEVRARVPEEHRAQFDELLAEARLTYRIRDERGVFSDIWAAGIARRAVLGAGRRLAARGRLHDPEHAIDAGFDELCALVRGGDGPTADELAARQALRRSRTSRDAPQALGDPPPPPPDVAALPPGVRRVMMAMGLVLDEMFAVTAEEHSEHLVRGMAAGPGVAEGTARLVAGPHQFDRIERGDVLVTPSTSEAFNILLPLLGGIVTDAGGLLSHAAIVAREYGIPGVVGTREGTQLIPDGARVRVDGDAGEVTVLR